MPTAHEHLAAFEHEKLGEDVERHHGKVEKGSGSKHAAMSAEDKRRHAALEHLIEAEAKVAHAQAALDHALAAHAAAEKAAGVDEPAEEETFSGGAIMPKTVVATIEGKQE